MPPTEEPEYVTEREAAELLGVSVATLERWAQAGRVESIPTPGGRLYRRDVIERMARELGADSGGAEPDET